MDNLFSFIFKAVSVEPRYEEGLCLAAGTSVACTACQDACPHDAIRVGRKVEIDPVDCSGCGLCVQECPTGALEPKVSFDRGASIKCSRVKGSAQTVHCLGRLQPSDLLRLLGAKESVTLARGACASCPVGSAAVGEAIERVREEALELASLHDRPVSIELIESEQLDESKSADAVSRRELLRGGWRSMQQGAGDLLAPLDPGDDERGLPSEMQRRYRIIEASGPEQDEQVPWALPRIGEECIMCPICTNACPTKAIERIFEAGSDGTLKLDPARCLGCDACMTACPVDAVKMDPQVSWGELSGGKREAYRRHHQREYPGSVSR